ncbi:hypothetical protein, partial [Escherichia coli]|uniref:hypothetical protein n=1 Tax=Escherichia coli TaxID=562 RepID=UPI001ADDE205
YEYGLADMPVVVGNVFHLQNKQGAKYSPPNNHLKGFQTAGGNKFILDDAPEAKVSASPTRARRARPWS